MRQTEMEADYLRTKLRDEIAHFFIEGSAAGPRKRGAVIGLELDVVGVEAPTPARFPSLVLPRRAVAEEVCIDGARGSLADDL